MLISNPWHISCMMRSLTEEYEQFITFPMVDFGTPLFINNWYCVICFSLNNSCKRLLTAVLNFTLSPSLCLYYMYQYIKLQVKISPCNCTNRVFCDRLVNG